MGARGESELTLMKNRTKVERKSERELVVTRTFNGPARIVFEAWTRPELLERWWAPKSFRISRETPEHSGSRLPSGCVGTGDRASAFGCPQAN
jgi:hypothetical protein